MPRVSVVVAAYNAEKYIGETLESIRSQTFGDFDVHVVDDCSTDGSAAVIHAYCATDDRFFYHRSPSNFGGPAGPRNIGVEKSSGEYIAFCDADDIWVSHKLEIQLAVAEETGADVISAVIRDFRDGERREPVDRPEGALPHSEISHAQLLLKNWIALSSVVARRSALEAAGPFNPARTHVAVEDFDMWLRLTQRGARAVRVGVPLVHYRKLATSISANKMKNMRKALNMIGEDYARREKGGLFKMLRPIHWLLYASTSAWTRAVRREL